MSEEFGVYRERPTRPLGVWEAGQWQFKAYSIALTDEPIDPKILESARRQLEAIQFPQAGGYGFLMIHAGEEAVWLLVDGWVKDILHHHLFRASLSQPETFQPVDDGTMACVWELKVTAHERESWIRHAMSEGGFDGAGYLCDTIEVSSEG